ncbi:MAG: DEAD/DEAH box helicase [Alphaproteobacteria bacterium]|nr:DEAD/DEAH box helicase [Alphaproteobacteria bacterium]
MRMAPGKKYGYIIIPVVIPDFVDIDEALASSEFDTVWRVIRALKSHDERLDATINKIQLNNKRPQNLIVATLGEENLETTASTQEQMHLQFKDAPSKIYAKLYEKLGTRDHWQTWAARVADIAKNHSERIQNLIHTDHDHEQAFKKFLNGLHRNINPNISEKEAIDMLAQHIIIKPIFETLFEGDEFSKKNPISIAMQKILDLLDQDYEEKDKGLLRYYEYVKDQIKDIDNAEGKQKIIKDLYENFFKKAFPKMVDQHGIIYTPIEIVDFMIYSVDDILKAEFGRSLSDENVNIIDPFTGTGTFITRLLQSGLIDLKDLPRKYEREIFANEMILLAYYVASVNIESVYHDLTGSDEIFKGICLTDTFQLGERPESELFTDRFPKNSSRLEKEVKTPIHVIISNPPYSAKQKKANDNAKNRKYIKLDENIRKTYVANSQEQNKGSVHDSYIRAFRWASDRIDPKNGGIIAFISNSGLLDNNSSDGLRKCLQKEFSSIYILDLKGDVNKDKSKEGENVFPIKTPVAITILVKNPYIEKKKADIFYADIGDNLKKQEKFERMNSWKSISYAPNKVILPNEHGDWLTHRTDDFGKLTSIVIDSKKFNKSSESFFAGVSRGMKTARDAWIYNSSISTLIDNIKTTINYYNDELDRFKLFSDEHKTTPSIEDLENFLDFDSKKMSWNEDAQKNLIKRKKYVFNKGAITTGMFRPFFKQNCYFDKALIHRMGKQPEIFPTKEHKNLAICFVGKGEKQISFPLITNVIPDLHVIATNQCAPLYYYIEHKKDFSSFFFSNTSDEEQRFERHDAITDYILNKYREIDAHITKGDIFTQFTDFCILKSI